MSFFLGNQSCAKLVRVHPTLVKVVERAIQITRQDFAVQIGVAPQPRYAATLQTAPAGL